MSNTLCPLHNEYNESLRWTFTEPLGTCIYNLFDQIAFIMGWLSVLSWTFALLPQIITNCKNKAAESQSFWFWLLWLVGDCCNFSGCLLTKNLITNIALALVYLSFTAFACLQFIWYEYFLRKHNFNKQENAYKHHVLFGAPSPSATLSTDKQKFAMDLATDLAMWDTPYFAKRYQALPNHAISPKLKKTLKILQRSPRMFALSSQLTKRMRREYETLQAQKRQQEQYFFPHDQQSEDEKEYSYPDTVTSSEPSDSPALNETNRVALEAAESRSVIKIYKDNNNMDADGSSAPLRLGANPNYGSMSTIMSTLTTMGVTVVMLCGVNTANNTDTYDSNSRMLLSENDSNSTNTTMLVMIGLILGWTSSLIYISSRIPQLKLMLNTKAVSGINPAFFCLTFSGNLTQCLSMMINREIYSNPTDLFNKLPWLSSAGVCIFQDGLILFLIYWYRGSDLFKSMSHINYSKGVMMPSPHYLITVNEVNNGKHKQTGTKKKNVRVKSLDEKNWNYNNAYYEYRYGDGAKNNNNNPHIMTNTV